MTPTRIPGRTARSVPGAATVSAGRVLDVALAGAALVIFGPIIVVVAILIWAESGRPLFFAQTRIGQGGRHFRIYKFRKFHEKVGGRGWNLTLQDDPRMTRLGRLLEKAKLDELPQIWNVLKGDMSVVGPRPESIAFADCFTPEFQRILDFTPGLFGPNQYYFRGERALFPHGANPEEFYRLILFPLKARIDLAYFPERTLAADLEWLLRGICAVLRLHWPPDRRSNAILAGIVGEKGGAFLQQAGRLGDRPA